MMSFTYVFGQNVIGNYSGFWASTSWNYKFEKDGNFEYVTAGHFGFTNTKGKYEIKTDTLILNATEFGKGKIEIKNEKFLIVDNCIIDIDLRYDYCKTNKKKLNHNSVKRNFKYPQTAPNNSELINDLKRVLEMIILESDLTKEFAKRTEINEPIFIQNYFEINEQNFSDLEIPDYFKFKEFGNPKYSLIFENINQNSDDITVEFEITNLIRSGYFRFKKENQNWKITSQHLYPVRK